MRVLLAGKFPPSWLNRLDFEGMARVPDAWVATQWRCADVVSSVPLRPDGAEPQTTHTVLAVKFARIVLPELHERLARHVALLQGEFDRRGVFGAPRHPPLVTTVVVADKKAMQKGPGKARRVVRWGDGAIRFLPQPSADAETRSAGGPPASRAARRGPPCIRPDE